MTKYLILLHGNNRCRLQQENGMYVRSSVITINEPPGSIILTRTGAACTEVALKTEAKTGLTT